jgi:hypothetical protein
MFTPLLLYAMIALNGCVILPIPTPERTVLAGKPVTEEELAFLAPYLTTKKEVIDRLGSPDLIWVEANLFAYNWSIRQGILIWGFVGSTLGDIEEIPKRYVLLIQFDEQERVRHFERAVRPAFKSYGDFLKDWVRDSHKKSSPGSKDKKEQDQMQ